MEKHKPQLSEVPETMLWTLHNRAIEAKRPDGVIHDPKAIEICEALNYNYEKNFGAADVGHAMRSLCFDREIVDFIKQFSKSTIINLGEGLETHCFRIPNEDVEWICIDLPEAIKIRERFILPDERHKHISMSATNLDWIDMVQCDVPAIITAQGLFMYLPEEDIKRLLTHIFASFTTCVVVFDTIPLWLSKKTMAKKGWKKTKYYTTPPMPWGINRRDIQQTFKDWLGEKIDIEDLGYPRFPRGIFRWIKWIERINFLQKLMPTIIKLSSKVVS